MVFKPIKTSFRLNDSIKLKGEAKAFSGAKIGDAKVSYKIVRQKFTPYRNYYRSVSNSVSKQIDAGTTVTNSDGSFTIPFKAIPSEDDLGNDKANAAGPIKQINEKKKRWVTGLKELYKLFNQLYIYFWV